MTFLQHITPLITWIHDHPEGAGIIIFLIAMGESIAIFGLIVPGSVVMTAVGALIGSEILPGGSTLLWAMAGAVLGDCLSYSFGYHFKEHIREMWPFRRYPSWLEKGNAFFLKHGGKSIILGRFVGPMRPLIPLIAGMMSMPPKRFLLADIPASLAWAPIYMLPGILLGAASAEMAPGLATEILLVFLGGLLILWMLGWLLKYCVQLMLRKMSKLLHNTWRRLSKNPFWQKATRLIVNPRKPKHHAQFVRSICLVLLIVSLACLSISVLRHGILTTWNEPLWHFFRSIYHPGYESLLVAITFLGKSYVLITALGLLLIWFAWRRDWWRVFHGGALIALLVAATGTLKHLLHNPRPSGLSQALTSYSFPSGHTTFSLAIATFFVVLISPYLNKAWRKIAYALALVFAGLIAFSRLYLGAHWLTDIVGGLLLGGICCLIVTLSYRRKIQRNPISVPRFFIIGFFALLLPWVTYMAHSYTSSVNNYQPVWQNNTLNLAQWWQTPPEKNHYQTTRFGNKTGTFNVQWAGEITAIKKVLLVQRWKPLPPRHFLTELQSQLTNNPNPSIRYYADKKPQLALTKRYQKGILILQLWQTHSHFRKSKLKLWAGIIEYRVPIKKKHWWNKNKMQISRSADLFAHINQQLPHYQWKKVSDNGTDLLLIKPLNA